MNPLFLKSILPEGFKTYTYTHEYSRHMFIVFACKKEFEIKNFNTIPDTALDEKRSRPAVYGQLTYQGTALLDLIGVHLKSRDDKTDLRLKQAKSIAQFIKNLNSKTPLVLTGDCNSHLKNVDIKVYNLNDYSADQPFNKFYNEISDHVPVSLSVEL